MLIKDGPTVEVYGSLEVALKALKNKCNKAGLFMEIKNRSFAMSKSEKRRAKDARALARRKRKRKEC